MKRRRRRRMADDQHRLFERKNNSTHRQQENNSTAGPSEMGNFHETADGFAPPPHPFWTLDEQTATPIRLRAENKIRDSFQVRPCPRPFDQFYCFNQGHCFTLIDREELLLPFCRCAPNFHGRRCEHLFDANFYDGDLELQRRILPLIPQPRPPPIINSASPTTANCSSIFLLFLPLLLVSLLLLLRHRLFK